MPRSLLTWFFLLIMATALAACCGSTACECDDAYADAIGLTFSTDTLGSNPKGFRLAEIDTVFLVRVPLDTAQRPVADTVQLNRTGAQVRQQPVIINNTTPFTQAGNRKLNQYAYQLYLAQSRRARHTFDYAIDSVQLTTVLKADGCCTCFQNTRKLVYVNGSTTPFDQTDPKGNNGLVPLPVQRP